ncbi:MAG: hypothetical protein J5691_07130 [Bacilli bacterium]|nr:hypothetical protein [Bacilli bacterium]
MKKSLTSIDIEKYRVEPIKKSKSRVVKKQLSGEDIDLLNDNRSKTEKRSICDTHEDGA